jgi:hypothetical protein
MAQITGQNIERDCTLQHVPNPMRSQYHRVWKPQTQSNETVLTYESLNKQCDGDNIKNKQNMFWQFSSRNVVMQSHFLSSQWRLPSCAGSIWKLVILEQPINLTFYAFSILWGWLHPALCLSICMLFPSKKLWLNKVWAVHIKDIYEMLKNDTKCIKIVQLIHSFILKSLKKVWTQFTLIFTKFTHDLTEVHHLIYYCHVLGV